MNEIWEEKPALLRCKKGSVKKILTKSLQKSTLENRKEYIVQTSKSFGVAQSKFSSALKKISGEPVRQNNTVAQDEDTAVMLGMDLLMKAKQKQAALEGDRRWIMDRKKLMEKLEKTLNLCCTLLLFWVYCIQQKPVVFTFMAVKARFTLFEWLLEIRRFEGIRFWLPTWMCFCECGSRKGNRKALEGKLTGACWTSFSKNNVWAGFLPTCLGMIYYHQEGNKALSMAKFSQILQVVLADLWDIWAWLTGI